MSFGLQDIMDFGGDGSSPDNSGNSGILSALENVGVNFAAGAASIGLNALGRSAGTGITSAYASPGYLARNPGTPPSRLNAGVSTNTLVFGGFLLAGLVLWAAFRRKD
jgi:hypothetical protein